MSKQGYLITLEGGEGTGKSSVGGEIFKRLKRLGLDVEFYREPGSSRIGEQIRKIVKAAENMDMSSKTETLLFQAARAQFVKEILEPDLESGKVVILDRFRDSSETYQGFMRGLGMKIIRGFNDWSTNGLMPSLTIFFDLDPEIGLKRKGESVKEDRLDSISLNDHVKVREGYWKLLNSDETGRWEVVDASKPKLEVINEVHRICTERLQLAGFIEKPQSSKERLG